MSVEKRGTTPPAAPAPAASNDPQPAPAPAQRPIEPKETTERASGSIPAVPAPSASNDPQPALSNGATQHTSNPTPSEAAADRISKTSRPISLTTSVNRPPDAPDPICNPARSVKERLHSFRRAYTTARGEAKAKKQNQQTIKHQLKELLESHVADDSAAIDQLNTIVDEGVGLEVEPEGVYRKLFEMNWGHLMLRQKVDWGQVVKEVKRLREGVVDKGKEREGIAE